MDLRLQLFPGKNDPISSFLDSVCLEIGSGAAEEDSYPGIQDHEPRIIIICF